MAPLSAQITLFETADERGEAVLGLGLLAGFNQYQSQRFANPDDAPSDLLYSVVTGIDLQFWSHNSDGDRFDNFSTKVWVSPSLPTVITGRYGTDIAIDTGYKSLFGTVDNADMLLLLGWGFSVFFQNYIGNYVVKPLPDTDTTSDGTSIDPPDVNYILTDINLGFHFESQFKIRASKRLYLGIELPLVSQVILQQAKLTGDPLVLTQNFLSSVAVFVPTQVDAEIGLIFGDFKEKNDQLYTVFNRVYYRFELLNNWGTINALTNTHEKFYFMHHSIGLSFFVN